MLLLVSDILSDMLSLRLLPHCDLQSQVFRFLKMLKEKGKKLFLLTNSPFYFVDGGMRYLLEVLFLNWNLFLYVLSILFSIQRQDFKPQQIPVWFMNNIYIFQYNLFSYFLSSVLTLYIFSWGSPFGLRIWNRVLTWHMAATPCTGLEPLTHILDA